MRIAVGKHINDICLNDLDWLLDDTGELKLFPSEHKAKAFLRKCGNLQIKKRAEERFAALKAGRKQLPREIGTPLYFIEDEASINPKTERTAEGDKIIEVLSKEFAKAFAACKTTESEE